MNGNIHTVLFGITGADVFRLATFFGGAMVVAGMMVQLVLAWRTHQWATVLRAFASIVGVSTLLVAIVEHLGKPLAGYTPATFVVVVAIICSLLVSDAKE